MLFKEIEQVLFRQVQCFLALKRLALGFCDVGATGCHRQGTPEVAVDLLLVFQPFARPLRHLGRRKTRRTAIMEDALIHQCMG